MLKDITFGRYVPAESLVHQLDPRTKIFFCLVFSFYIFFVTKFLPIIIVFVFVLFFIKISKIRFIVYLKNLKPVIPVLVLTYISNIISFANKDVLIKLWFFYLPMNTTLSCLVVTFRMTFLVMLSSLVSFTTTPMELKKSLEWLMRPLNLINVPVEDVTLVITLTLRLIPTVVEQANKVVDSQKIRGVDFFDKNIIKRAKNYVYVIIPLLISLLRQADELAMAMECRCYTNKGRTKFKTLCFKKMDFLFFCITICVFLLSVVLNSVQLVF